MSVSPFAHRALLGVALCFCAAACHRGAVEGTVLDARGEALHGVAVTVVGTSTQGLTTSLGKYRVECPPGLAVLDFSKTGYTPGRLEVPTSQVHATQAKTVTLWPLPEAKGVYFFDDFRYAPTMSVDLQQYQSLDAGTIYGTTRWADVLTSNPTPLLIAFKLPVHGARLSKLELTDATAQSAQGTSTPVEVWVRADELAITPRPISDPDTEAALFQIELPGPLGAGTYAVHWGALDGDVAAEPRVFCFTIVDALQAQPDGEAPAASSAARSESTAHPRAKATTKK